MFVTYDRGAETRDFLMGEWIENNDTEERTRIVFHPETAVFYNFQNYDSLLFHSWFSFPNGGALWETLNNYWFEITICRKGNDTININLFQRFAGCEVYYSTQMIRKIP